MLKFGDKPVYLACGHTDMRKQINGLSAKVQADFALDPFDGALFVFCNRARNRIKVLEWDGDGDPLRRAWENAPCSVAS